MTISINFWILPELFKAWHRNPPYVDDYIYFLNEKRQSCQEFCNAVIDLSSLGSYNGPVI